MLPRKIVNQLRSTIPADSAFRRSIGAVYRGIRYVPQTYRATSQNLKLSRLHESGLKTYEDWLYQEAQRPVDLGGDRPFPLTVIIVTGVDGAGPREVAKTRASLKRAIGTRADVEVREVAEGSPADSLRGALPGASAEGFTLFLRAGSALRPSAIDEIAVARSIDPEAAVITFDSDQLAAGGTRHSPLFRPTEFSPEMLLGANYIGNAFAIDQRAIARFAPESVSAREIWRLLLRVTLAGGRLTHVPHVLLSEPERPLPRPSAEDATMLEGVLRERGESAEVAVSGSVLRTRFAPETLPSVSIVIPTRHGRENMQRLIASMSGTDYPEFDITVIDNGGQSAENDAWYAELFAGLAHRIIWWTETPFNYSRVNNVAARASSGEVVLFLNDDTEILDASWLREMVGHLMRDGVGSVGLQMREGTGLIQHAGVMVGPGGFADNLFAAMSPGSDTLIGPTDWYRNSLAATGACVALRRSDFEAVGGLDERFILTGSDVVLGLDQVIQGRRNVIIPSELVRHYESLTRGTSVPEPDFFASYWRYYPWLQKGDPYISPNVSRLSSTPAYRSLTEPDPVHLALAVLGRPVQKHVQQMTISEEAQNLIHTAAVSRSRVEEIARTHAEHAAPFEVKTINWFIPEIDMPFFGGLNTAFRMAAKLARENGVKNRFVVLGNPAELYYRSALDAAFEGLGTESEFVFYDGSDEKIALIPAADAAVATLWLTAHHVAKASDVKRRFYLVQDYEPEFYPASSMFAMAEESYRLGLYALCNTESMFRTYTQEYSGKALAFTPAVDQGIYHARGRVEKTAEEPVTIFAYARDHFRNCWELVYAALSEVKRRHGTGVKVIVAGARYLPPTADFLDLGLMDYRATAQFYRRTDIGITMQISRHPSYLPLELMSCGVAMVVPDASWFKWIFRSGTNSLESMRSVTDMVDNLELLITDEKKRREISAGALETISANHSDWDGALSGIYGYMCDPEAAERR